MQLDTVKEEKKKEKKRERENKDERHSVLAILCNHGTVEEKRKKVTGTVVWIGSTIVVFFI